MGKKSKLKQLRKIAGQLPTISVSTCEKHFVEGKELIKQGHTEIEDVKVNPDATYIQSMPVKMAVNHNRRIKKMFNKYGVAGIKAYVNAVEQHIKKKESVKK